MMSLALGLLMASNCGGGVDVRVAPDKTLDLEAKNAPISSVLECLSERAGFKMVMEPGIATTQPVTISLSRRTPAQALVGVLDGLLLNYAFSSDRTGAQVLMLLVSGRAARAPGQATPGAGAPGGRPGPRRDQALLPDPESTYQSETPADPQIDRPPGSAPVYVPGNNPVSMPPGYPPPGYPQPGQIPLYPEARPLSPLTLRDSRQIHIADAPFSRSPGAVTDSSSRPRR